MRLRPDVLQPLRGIRAASSVAALLALTTLLAAVWSLPALATSIVSVPFSELVRRSPVIVHATVIESSAHWNEDRTLIVTDVRLRVDEVLRGTPGSEITITQPGGRVGKVRVDVDGAAPFLVGEEVVLFLSDGSGGGDPSRGGLAPEGAGVGAPSGGLRIMGLSRGRFPVVRDERTGEKWVLGVDDSTPRGTVGALGVGGAPAGTAGEPSGLAGGRSRVRLADFLGDVRGKVRALAVPQEK